MRRLRIFGLVAAVCLLLSGCGGDAAAATGGEVANPYVLPPFRGAAFHEDGATDCGALRLDDSCLDQGYVAVLAQSEKRMKFQILSGEETYNYDLPDREAQVFPLNMGSGSYTFKLMEQIEGTKYACTWSGSRQVTLEDEFEPFLRPSQMVAYSASSRCVALTKQLAESCETDTELASAIYEYLVDSIRYDRQKAATVQSGYLPDPDETLATGKGICFDYAALAAAMLRSAGIPCKLITGYVENDVYHAWNCFYLESQGWVTVQIAASPDTWQRVDITFAASGTPTNALQDDSRYTPRFTY